MRNSDWALLKEYATQFEADLDVATLEMQDVPAIVRGAETGIYGPGFTGPTQHGVRVYVPRSMLEFARELIAAVSRPGGRRWRPGGVAPGLSQHRLSTRTGGRSCRTLRAERARWHPAGLYPCRDAMHEQSGTALSVIIPVLRG